MYLYTLSACACVSLFLQELLQLEDRLGNVTRGAVQNTIERFTFPHKYKKVRLQSGWLHSRGQGRGIVSCLLEGAWLPAGDTLQAQEPLCWLDALQLSRLLRIFSLAHI